MTTLDNLDTLALVEELREVAAELPVDDMNRSELLALIYLMRAVINRVNDFDDRHPAPLLTLRRGKRQC